MDQLGRLIAVRLGISRRTNTAGTVIGALVGALVAAGVVLAAATLSNMLSLGPAQVVAAQVVHLTTVKDLRSPLVIDEENEVKFRIQTTSQVTNGTLWLRLSAQGTTLGDPTIVEIDYRHPTKSRSSVSLTPSGGSLEGVLKSGWEIPNGYDEEAKLEITFMSNAPTTAYVVDLWVEGTRVNGSSSTSAPGQGQQSQGQSFSLDADSDGFVGLTGATGTNPMLTVKAGESNDVTIVRQDSMHNFAIYTQACGGGFCDGNLIPGGRSADVRSSSPTATLTFSFPTAGATLYYICDYHPDSMKGTINVVQ